MADRRLSTFESTVDKTNHVLKEIALSRGWTVDCRRRAYAALRAVLHALRDRLTVSEAAHFGAQLPLLIRGIFYEGWDPDKLPMKMNRANFLERVRQEMPSQLDDNVEHIVVAVLSALRRHVTDGEWNDVRSILPRDLAVLVP